MECKVCKSNAEFVFGTEIMQKYDVDYFKCNNCGFLFTEKPFWLEEAYEYSINVSDTGILRRNIRLSKITLLIICTLFDQHKKFLDYAGGFGVFTRLMRDKGLDYYWLDKYTPNLFSKGFEYKSGYPVELLSAFEAFEHYENPVNQIEEMLEISTNIFFSTTLLPKSVPDPNEWHYFGRSHGQHIAFYEAKTFEYIAQKYNLNYYNNSQNLHLLTKKSINPFFFKMLTKLNKLGISKLLGYTLESKTSKDWNEMKRFDYD